MSMLKDGHYMAWFKTERGQGTGRVLLRDGKISGGDTVITYGGSYQVDGSRFTATLTTQGTRLDSRAYSVSTKSRSS
jgi:hypothetical protein